MAEIKGLKQAALCWQLFTHSLSLNHSQRALVINNECKQKKTASLTKPFFLSFFFTVNVDVVLEIKPQNKRTQPGETKNHKHNHAH